MPPGKCGRKGDSMLTALIRNGTRLFFAALPFSLMLRHLQMSGHASIPPHNVRGLRLWCTSFSPAELVKNRNARDSRSQTPDSMKLVWKPVSVFPTRIQGAEITDTL